MSHPSSDPAQTAITALLAGLTVPDPAKARILEIGCGSGQNLIPLALRWPKAVIHGIDCSEIAIEEARNMAEAAGAGTIRFEVADLLDRQTPDERYDFIIAHGFFSWVPDAVKQALLRSIARTLGSNGVAVLSFNVASGWRARWPLVEKARAIRHAGANSWLEALTVLRDITTNPAELAILDDMRAKGEDLLHFDDFGPVNDAWDLPDVVRLAKAYGLRWLGESVPSENLPRVLSREVTDQMRIHHAEPLSFQAAIDEKLGRTHRSLLLCREDAEVSGRIDGRAALDWHVAPPLGAKTPGTIPVRGWIDQDNDTSVRQDIQQIQSGELVARTHAVIISPELPEFPRLQAFRMACARRLQPLVDAWHRSCAFPPTHYGLLTKIDGSRHRDELRRLAIHQCPGLRFDAWLEHLAQRGMFG